LHNDFYLNIRLQGIILVCIRCKAHIGTVFNNRVRVHTHIELAITARVDAQLVREDVNRAVFDTLEVDRSAARAEVDLTVRCILDTY